MNNSANPEKAEWRRAAALILALVLGTVLLYWPVRTFDFLNFDDPSYVTENSRVLHGLKWNTLVWAFITREASNWHPVTWLSHALDCQFFGQRPGAHHLVNLAIHATNVMLLFIVLRQMTRATWRSAIVAALFGWHPLHVESVAWIAERKDVLSAMFGLLTLWAYAKYAGQTSTPFSRSRMARNCYLLAVAAFTLGLMSKPTLVTMPCLLLLLDFWPLHRIAALGPPSAGVPIERLVLEKFPFFCLSAGSSVVTYWAQSRGGSVASVENLPLSYRITNALIAYDRYLEKMIWPVDLACFYPLVPGWPPWEIGLCVGALLAISAFAFYACRRAPYLLVGWLWFLGMLVPVIGLIQVGTQAWADRYSYLPLIGIFVAIVWSAAALSAAWRIPRSLVAIGASLVLMACAAATRRQLAYWRDSETLFAHAVKISPQARICHLNLGNARLVQGRSEEAIPEFQTALKLSPNFALAHVNWANALRLQGKLDEALSHFTEALRLQTNYPEVHYVCGNVLTLQSKFPEAEAHYLEALHQKPDYPQAHNNLGNLCELQGKPAAALQQYYEATRLDPDYAEGHYYLGGALARQRNLEEAARHFATAIKLNPDYALALNDLAWILATSQNPQLRNVGEAVRLAEHACAASREKDVNCIDTLAFVYAEAHRFPEAVQAAERASSLARGAGNTNLAAQLDARVQSYRLGQPGPVPTRPQSGEQSNLTNLSGLAK